MKTALAKRFHSVAPGLLIVSLAIACGCKKESAGGGGSADMTEYTLKASFPRVGVTVSHTHKSTIELRGEVLDKDGKRLKDLNDRKSEDKRWKETTLAANPAGLDDWTKLKVVIDRYSIDEMGDAPPSRKFQLAGRTFLVERNESAVVFKDESGKLLTVDEEAELRLMHAAKDDPNGVREFVPHRDFLPDKPVRVGQSYDLPGEKMAKSLSVSSKLGIDPDKAVAKGKLVRKYEKGGHRFGVIEVEITLPAKSNPQITVTSDSKMTAVIYYDGCIDGSVCEMTGNMKIDGNLEGRGPRGTFKVRYNARLELTETELKN